MTWSRWIRTVEVEPGVDAGSGAVIGGQIEALLRTGCKLVHVDVGDGLDHSVAQLSILTPLVHRYEGVVDLHLTAGDPLLLFGAAAAVGADSVTFDADAVEDMAAAIQAARDAGLQVGVAVGPGGDPDAVAQEAQEADILLCTGHDEGLAPIVRRLRLALPSTVALQVEGPAVEEASVLPELYEAGARVFVVGELIFSREDLPRAYRRLVQEFA
jgi:pentose-5-phosphate-3-epimerase